jgi:hypothetical protein
MCTFGLVGGMFYYLALCPFTGGMFYYVLAVCGHWSSSKIKLSYPYETHEYKF